VQAKLDFGRSRSAVTLILFALAAALLLGSSLGYVLKATTVSNSPARVVVVHDESGWPVAPPAIAVEFKGGWFDGVDQLITVHGDEEFSTYPGGRKEENLVRESPTDALTTRYRRVATVSEPRITPAALKSGGKARHQPAWTTAESEMLRMLGGTPAAPVRSDSTR